MTPKQNCAQRRTSMTGYENYKRKRHKRTIKKTFKETKSQVIWTFYDWCYIAVSMMIF